MIISGQGLSSLGLSEIHIKGFPHISSHFTEIYIDVVSLYSQVGKALVTCPNSGSVAIYPILVGWNNSRRYSYLLLTPKTALCSTKMRGNSCYLESRSKQISKCWPALGLRWCPPLARGMCKQFLGRPMVVVHTCRAEDVSRVRAKETGCKYSSFLFSWSCLTKAR